MKKLAFLTLVIVGIGCNSSSNNTSTKDSATKSNTGVVENVNGNIPDTTNTVDISGKKRVDSTKIDSSKIDSTKGKK